VGFRELEQSRSSTERRNEKVQDSQHHYIKALWGWGRRVKKRKGVLVPRPFPLTGEECGRGKIKKGDDRGIMRNESA